MMKERQTIQWDRGLSVAARCRTVIELIEKGWEFCTSHNISLNNQDGTMIWAGETIELDIVQRDDEHHQYDTPFTIPLELDEGTPDAPDSHHIIAAYIHVYGGREGIEFRRDIHFAPNKIITCCARLRKHPKNISHKDQKCRGWLKRIEFFEDNRNLLSFLQYYPDGICDYRNYTRLDIYKFYGLRKIAGLDHSPSQEDLEKFKGLLQNYELLLSFPPHKRYTEEGPISLDIDESSFGESKVIVVSIAGIPVVVKDDIDVNSEAVRYMAGLISKLKLFDKLNGSIAEKVIEEY